MAICTYKLITCQYIRTYLLTSKHVTLSQAMTLSNKSYNGPKVNHKLGYETNPKQAMNTGLKQSQARLGVAYLHLGEPLHLGEQHPRLGRPESPPISSSGSPRHTYLRLGGPFRLGGDPFLPGEAPCPRLSKGRPTGTQTSDHFTAQKWKINQVGRILYLLKRRRNPKKPRGHFLNPKPLISRTPLLDPLQIPRFRYPRIVIIDAMNGSTNFD